MGDGLGPIDLLSDGLMFGDVDIFIDALEITEGLKLIALPMLLGSDGLLLGDSVLSGLVILEATEVNKTDFVEIP